MPAFLPTLPRNAGIQQRAFVQFLVRHGTDDTDFVIPATMFTTGIYDGMDM